MIELQKKYKWIVIMEKCNRCKVYIQLIDIYMREIKTKEIKQEDENGKFFFINSGNNKKKIVCKNCAISIDKSIREKEMFLTFLFCVTIITVILYCLINH